MSQIDILKRKLHRLENELKEFDEKLKPLTAERYKKANEIEDLRKALVKNEKAAKANLEDLEIQIKTLAGNYNKQSKENGANSQIAVLLNNDIENDWSSPEYIVYPGDGWFPSSSNC